MFREFIRSSVKNKEDGEHFLKLAAFQAKIFSKVKYSPLYDYAEKSMKFSGYLLLNLITKWLIRHSNNEQS